MRNIIIVALLTLLFSSSCVTIDPSYRQFVYDTITIEIQPTVDHPCDTTELESVKQYLEIWKVCDADQITIVIHPEVMDQRLAWTGTIARQFEGSHRKIFQPAEDFEDRNPCFFIAFLSGTYVDNNLAGCIGINYHTDAIIVFKWPYSGTHRMAVILHELLHGMGLVDIRARHQAPINPLRAQHCNNSTCTMFWIVPEIPRLCRSCLDDLNSMTH